MRPPTLALVALLTVACAEHRELGAYRATVPADRVPFFGCQPRTDLFFIDSASRKPTYLGSCGTPRYVQQHLGGLHEPSCFAIAPDGGALIYFHTPKWCGAGKRAQRKPAGVYRHTRAGGDSLLYTEREVGRVWSSDTVPPGTIRVTWSSRTPSRSGARCAQRMLIGADGREEPIGTADSTRRGCR